MNKNLELYEIRAIGSLLQGYHTDLSYIDSFQKFKQGDIGFDDYLYNCDYSLTKFLSLFKIARCVQKDEKQTLLSLLRKWIDNPVQDLAVDSFAKLLLEKGITHGKTMTSLASKLLFLNNPWEVIPMDRFTRNALQCNNNNYVKYYEKSRLFHIEADHIQKPVESMIIQIEAEFNQGLRNIETIRYNRLKDILLLFKGQQ